MTEIAEPVPVETVAVFAAPDEITAGIVRGALISEGIDAFVGEQVTGAYSRAFSLGEGFWGELRVKSEDADRARRIVASLEAGEGAVSDAELAAEAEASSDPGV